MNTIQTPPSQPVLLPAPFSNSSPAPKLVTQGAEALVYRTTFLSSAHTCALKFRPSKPYRHPTLDKRLTRHRILSEARTLVRCLKEGVTVPAVLALDVDSNGDAGDDASDRAVAGGGGGWMMLEWIEGRTVKEVLVQRARRRKEMWKQIRVNEDVAEEMKSLEDHEERWKMELKELMCKIGAAVGRLHEIGVIHGDLTTSNMMLRPSESTNTYLRNGDVGPTNGDHASRSSGLEAGNLNGEIVLIDFGLAGQSIQDEDKAVDLYVLERAFGSTHPEDEHGFQDVLQAYRESYKGAKVVLKRLEEVRMRGRKRSMVG